jgi:hypothetical protein
VEAIATVSPIKVLVGEPFRQAAREGDRDYGFTIEGGPLGKSQKIAFELP